MDKVFVRSGVAGVTEDGRASALVSWVGTIAYYQSISRGLRFSLAMDELEASRSAGMHYGQSLRCLYAS